MLNVFGQTFKDNGYQLMNDRDSPIWQNPAYWPVTFRITPNWHLESTNKVAVDQPNGTQAEQNVTENGFDVSGLDILSGGTLYKNISMLLVPSSDNTGAFHFESVWARMDNIGHSSWFNLKMGKFELDNVISEKRILNLSNNGGFYVLYHFSPLGDNNYLRSNGRQPVWNGVDGSLAQRPHALFGCTTQFERRQCELAFQERLFHLHHRQPGVQCRVSGGVDRVGGYLFLGNAPTYNLTSFGVPITGIGNKPFNREGVFGIFYAKKLDFQLFYQHGWDSAYFGTSTPATMPLPLGARAPSWNGAFVETHYVFNPQLDLHPTR